MKHCIVIFCLFCVLPVLAFAQIDLQPVAIVRLAKTEQITVKQFKEYVSWLSITRAMATGSGQLTDGEKRQALDELGNQFLACQAAEQERLTVTDREINQYFDQSIKSFAEGLAQVLGHNPTDAEIDAELRKRTGMTRASYRELMKRTLTTENYLKSKKEHLFKALKPPTDAEILTIYNEARSRSIFENGFIRPDTARIRMLIVPVRSPAEKTAAQATANNLAKQIGNDTAKFDEAFRDYAKANSGYLSGDGYVYKHDQVRKAMGAGFVDAVFNLKQGDISKILERPDGFFIVKVIETYRTKTLSLDDTYNLEDPQAASVRQIIGNAQMQQRFMETLQQASEELVAELRKKGSVEIKDDTYGKISW